MRESWPGYAAALWALIFAVLHVVWAAGWYVGLDWELSRKAFQQPWFLVYDLVVAGLCALAVWVALALVRPWGRRLPRPLVGGLAWCGSAMLVLRAGAGVAQTAYVVYSSPSTLAVYQLWELWFSVGAVIFGLSTWRFWRASTDTLGE